MSRFLLFSALLITLAAAASSEFNFSSFANGFSVVIGIAVLGVIILLLISNLSLPSPPPGTKLPPKYSVGIPLVGNFIDFAHDPLKCVAKAKEKLGGVFTIQLFHEKCTFLVGARYQQHFFEASDEELDQAEVYQFMTPIFGRGIVYDAPIEKRRQQMRALGMSLKPSNLRTYSPMIAKEAHEYFRSKWGESGQIDLLPSMAELIILTASSTLMGPEVRHELFLEVSELYKMLDQGLTPISVFFPNAPLAAHSKRDKARKEMSVLFSRIIKKRRDNNAQGTDLLQRLIDFTYKDGSKFTDDEITGMLVATLFAGQHTSSITSTWSILFLLDSKRKGKTHYKKALEEIASLEPEQGAFAKGEGIDAKIISNESFLYSCVKESIRMFPPLILLMRRVKQALTTFDGHYIPKGHRIMVSNAVAQRLPEVFQDPNEWDPERWESFDISKLPKYSFIGFGAGIHTCMGESFAFLQIQTILTVLFSMYEMELVTPFPEADYEAMVVPPKGPNMVKYKLREGFKFSSVPKPATDSKVHVETKVEDDADEVSKEYTLEEIAKHNKKGDAWLVVKGKVYDVTNYVHLHQGGDNAILKHAGQADATEAVFGPQHPKTVPTLLERFLIGKVKKSAPQVKCLT